MGLTGSAAALTFLKSLFDMGVAGGGLPDPLGFEGGGRGLAKSPGARGLDASSGSLIFYF